MQGNLQVLDKLANILECQGPLAMLDVTQKWALRYTLRPGFGALTTDLVKCHMFCCNRAEGSVDLPSDEYSAKLLCVIITLFSV